MTYLDLFRTATGGKTPYLWQCRLACGEAPEGANCDLEHPNEATLHWLSQGIPCTSHLIDIPTGLGKTAGVVMAWIWNRYRESEISNLKFETGGSSTPWPRRLVYCLPMRTLVEQTAESVDVWLWNLLKAYPENQDIRWLCGCIEDEPIPDEKDPPNQRMRSPIVLMGGEDQSPSKRDWDLYPEKPCILIGTQDMLLSRALNRGYGMSRYRWPMHFALLNNDCLWVMDEVQLMGAGLETSSQLQGLRKSIGLTHTCSTWWMSATVAPERLKTLDFRSGFLNLPIFQLTSDDSSHPQAQERMRASKSVVFSGLQLSETKAADITDYASAVAELVAKTHEPDSLSLVILNRVDRAQAVFSALESSFADIPHALIHSRFRPEDRAEHMKLLDHPEGGIVVSTQAIEAGLDVSARHLFTELAPWSSLVQRIGRCNRDGKQPQGGTIHWIDLHSDDEKKLRELSLPYSIDALTQARASLARITDASPDTLRAHTVAEKSVIRPILRKKDLLDFFDTTPDLAGLDLDVSRYIRDGNDTDVEVFWREVPKDEEPNMDIEQPNKTEICRVSISAFRAFIKKAKSKRIWRWQGLSGEWESVNDQTVYPGITCLIATDLGGYSAKLGWTGDPKNPVTPIYSIQSTIPFESNNDDPTSRLKEPETLESHTTKVVNYTKVLAKFLITDKYLQEALTTAARWHDLGKTHYHFQKMLLGEEKIPEDGTAYLAKSNTNSKCGRRFFRHELASALGWLALTKGYETRERDLIAYLIAAHHGKVRLSIRAMPNEQGPKNDPDCPFARGVWHGDQLPYQGWPAIQLNEQKLPPVILDLTPLTVGGGGEGNPSWLERTLTLRDRPDLGVFILAYLETLLRSADGRASGGNEADNEILKS